MSCMAFPSTNCTTTTASCKIAWIAEIPMLVFKVFFCLSICAHIFWLFHKPLIFILFNKFLLLISINLSVIIYLGILWLFFNFFNSLTSLLLSFILLILFLLLSLFPSLNYLLAIIFKRIIFNFRESLLSQLTQVV